MPPTRSSLLPLLFSLLLLALSPTLAQDEDYPDPEGTIPKSDSDPSATLAPAITASPQPEPGEDFGATCAAPGVSAASSGATRLAVSLRNLARVDFTVSKLSTSGAPTLRGTVPPGATFKLPGAYLGQRWVVATACGECIAVVRVRRAKTYDLVDAAAERDCPNFPGRWDRPVRWDVIPVGVAHVPGSGGKLLGFAARSKDHYLEGANKDLTEGQLYTPKTGRLVDLDLVGHDIFCGALAMLPDGRLFAGGGGTGDNSYKVSTFDPATRRWTRWPDMNIGHWYGTAIVTRDDRVLVSLGTDQTKTGWDDYQNFPEISGPRFDFSKPWGTRSGIDYEGRHADKKHWYPQQVLMSNGRVLHFGTQNAMYVISTVKAGSIAYVGDRNTQRDEDQAWGATSVFYDAGRVLALGGIEGWNNDSAPHKNVLRRAIKIDFANPKSVKADFTNFLHYNRAFPNAIALPDGNVLVLGGKDNTRQWDDTMSVLTPELWNPVTEQWTLLNGAKMRKPRNYHAVCILMQEGTVFCGGGGLCGDCTFNEANSEIFHPPYLFKEDGSARPRPKIVSVRGAVAPQKAFKVRVRGAKAGKLLRVSMSKQSSITHNISTDQRLVKLTVTGRKKVRKGVYDYTVVAKMNRFVLVKGYWFLFVVNGDGTPSTGAEVVVE